MATPHPTAHTAVSFATPVYFGDLAESLKAFLDRLRRICRHENGPRGRREAGRSVFWLGVAVGFLAGVAATLAPLLP